LVELPGRPDPAEAGPKDLLALYAKIIDDLIERP
jgi:hypothetical protein